MNCHLPKQIDRKSHNHIRKQRNQYPHNRTDDDLVGRFEFFLFPFGGDQFDTTIDDQPHRYPRYRKPYRTVDELDQLYQCRTTVSHRSRKTRSRYVDIIERLTTIIFGR